LLDCRQHYKANNYGISQNPDTKVYILVFSNKYFDYCCKKCGNKYESSRYNQKWCRSCQINQLKNDFTNWTSGNEKIDGFIQKKQLEFSIYDDPVFEWIPYNKLIIDEDLGNNCLTTAIWKDEPLYYGNGRSKKNSYERVCLKYLHNSQDINDKFLTEVLEFI
jgi:hypothetical protein